jgi:hypothetical protein
MSRVRQDLHARNFQECWGLDCAAPARFFGRPISTSWHVLCVWVMSEIGITLILGQRPRVGCLGEVLHFEGLTGRAVKHVRTLIQGRAGGVFLGLHEVSKKTIDVEWSKHVEGCVRTCTHEISGG